MNSSEEKSTSKETDKEFVPPDGGLQVSWRAMTWRAMTWRAMNWRAMNCHAQCIRFTFA